MPCANGQFYTHDFLDMLTCGLPKRERESRLFAVVSCVNLWKQITTAASDLKFSAAHTALCVRCQG